MKTIIHIGQHKTGTTSIQHFLQDNRNALAKQGLYVPSKIAGYNHPSHFILNVYALAEGRFSFMKEEIIANKGTEYVSELERALKEDIEKMYKQAFQKKCHSVIWSNEGLYLLNAVKEYTRLCNLFSDYSTEIEVICCFRDVESYRESYMKELAKKNISFSDNPDSYRYLNADSWLFDYDRKKHLLSQVFDICTYFSYDPHDNVKKFLETLHINSIYKGNYKLNVTAGSHDNWLQRIKKRFAMHHC